MEADGAVDAQTAPTAPWKTLRVFHELPQGTIFIKSPTKNPEEPKRKTAPNEDHFLAHVERVDRHYAKQSIPVLMSMATALMGIGKRTKKLNKAALKVAKTIGPIDFDPGRCDPYDVAKHLTSPYAKQKLDL